jgi:hypothetical protein
MLHDPIDRGSLLSNGPSEVTSFRPSLDEVLFQGSQTRLHHAQSESEIRLRRVVFVTHRFDLRNGRRLATLWLGVHLRDEGELVRLLRFPLLGAPSSKRERRNSQITPDIAR